MIRRILILTAAALTAAVCADLQQPAPGQTMQVILRPDGNALVRETRRILLEDAAETDRSVVFEHGDARIVPGSIQLVPPPGLQIQRRSVPEGMDNGRVWDLSGRATGDEPLTIAYELQGLKWKPRYTLTYRPGQKQASLQAAVEITNESHLDLQSAKVSIDLLPAATPEAPDDPPELHVHPPALDLPDGWTKTIQLRTGDSPNLLAHLPADVVYRYAPEVHGDAVYRLLELTSERDGGDREFMAALPKGPMVVNVVNDKEGINIPVAVAECDFATSDKSEDEPLTVDLGEFREVTVERTKLQMQRTNLEFDRLGRVSGSDTIETWRLTAENGTPTAIRIQLRQSFLDNWDLSSGAEPAMLDDYTAQWAVQIDPGACREIVYTITRHEGTRAE